MTNIIRLTDRKQDIRGAGPSAYVKQRIAEAAESLNLAGTLAARVELANEALCRLVELMYLADIDGRPANADASTGRILIPLPWGSAGWRHWGLRYHEAVVMRSILLGRQAAYKSTQAPPLFVYDGDMRCWMLNARDYDTYHRAQGWLHLGQFTLAEWKHYLRQYRNGAATVQKAYRNSRRDSTEVV